MWRILDAADGSPNGARWAAALALGLRQGEVLGLRWCDVDLERGMLSTRKNRLRPVYQHGCPKSCGSTPGRCPDRVRGNDETGPTKSRAGRRVVGVPESLAELLRRHRAQQDLDRERARPLWVDGDYVFTSKVGEPLTRTPTITPGRHLPSAPALVMLGFTMLGTRRRRCRWCWASQSGR